MSREMEFRLKKEMRPESGRRLGKGGNCERFPGALQLGPRVCNVLLVLPLGMEVSVNNTKKFRPSSAHCVDRYTGAKLGSVFVPVSIFVVSLQKGEPGKQNPRAGCILQLSTRGLISSSRSS